MIEMRKLKIGRVTAYKQYTLMEDKISLTFFRTKSRPNQQVISWVSIRCIDCLHQAEEYASGEGALAIGLD
jgi:hypothetical protein